MKITFVMQLEAALLGCLVSGKRKGLGDGIKLLVIFFFFCHCAVLPQSLEDPQVCICGGGDHSH